MPASLPYTLHCSLDYADFCTAGPTWPAKPKKKRKYTPTGRSRGRPPNPKPASPPQEEKPPPLVLALGNDDAARAIGVSPAKMRQMLARGLIASVTIGRRRVVTVETLRKVMAEGVK